MIIAFLVSNSSLLFADSLFAAEDTVDTKANIEEVSTPSDIEVMNAVVDYLHYLENKEKVNSSEVLMNSSESSVNTKPLNAEVKVSEDEEANAQAIVLIPQKLPNHKDSIDQMEVIDTPEKLPLEGWVYLGRFSAEKWENRTLMHADNQIPIPNKRYQVVSTLHLRDALPVKGKLGRIIRQLNMNTKVTVRKIQRSGKKGDYWAYIEAKEALIKN
ncbi:MAG: Unknown protein [uncultured Thiotrichaceae bacterium]|uniref:SH3b domain-containing protein n=1 Tax=uncultured Thiotrichaceae bacterium TaxID=298394 RepID=A0A6S6SPK6_9GAMM|nr:MAG: Unknown protein [uncultured Thiotrichaceae bacterium]